MNLQRILAGGMLLTGALMVTGAARPSGAVNADCEGRESAIMNPAFCKPAVQIFYNDGLGCWNDNGDCKRYLPYDVCPDRSGFGDVSKATCMFSVPNVSTLGYCAVDFGETEVIQHYIAANCQFVDGLCDCWGVPVAEVSITQNVCNCADLVIPDP
ncbi:MAG: hypothetical protein KDA58_05670 [Planctomycetaceae bacterium]|nr:hypothetical protein [Planctomycetaceae bacterium]